jgi:OOP family OmpA-OmpF porin
MIVALAAGCASAPAQQSAVAPTAPAQPPPQTAAAAPKPAAGPDSLQVLFEADSATLSSAADGVVDHAARLFREGNPVVMTVAGHSDASGSEFGNLILSAKRAAAVKDALVARGIPAQRLELEALGTADPAVPADGTSPENRRVVITWR